LPIDRRLWHDEGVDPSITTDEIHEDDGQPATKRDLRLLKGDLVGLDAKMDRRFDELRDYFDAKVEIIKDEMRGANADEISLLKDKEQDHEQRLRNVEQRIGLR
jgi:hypothetical protein